MSQIVNLVMQTWSGDIGGASIAKFAGQNATADAYTPAQATSAQSAVSALWTALKTYVPIDIVTQVNQVVQFVDEPSGGLLGEVSASALASPMTGTGAGVYVAGCGARIYWHTSTIKNRRLIRGATYFTPVIGVQFNSSGVLQGTSAAAIAVAAQNYITAMTTAGLVAGVYSRASKPDPQGGLFAAITGVSVSNVPCSVRSRRS